jgi:hypothetical protein
VVVATAAGGETNCCRDNRRANGKRGWSNVDFLSRWSGSASGSKG